MKETRLDDSASIYSKRNEESEKEKWSQMNGKEKWQYFSQYYLLKLCAIIVLSIFAMYLFVTILGPKDKLIFEMVLVNSNMEESKIEEMKQEIETLLKPEKREIVMLDDSYYISEKEQGDMSSEQKLSVCYYANELDIIVANRSVFEKYAKLGFFCDLAELLPTDQYSQVKEQLVFASTEEQKEETAYGISLEGSKQFEKYDTQISDPVIGIVSNSKNVKNAVSVLESYIK